MVADERVTDVGRLYDEFFAKGGAPASDEARPWRYRRPVTSMGRPSVEFLIELARRRPAGRVLDLGSGLTSYVLRALMREQPRMAVWTIDTSLGWLAKTAHELVRDGLNTDRCMMLAAFEASPASAQTFDLVSVDFGNTALRLSYAPALARWLAPDGVMLLDDWHMGHYAVPMRAALEQQGLAVRTMEELTDEFGRYVAIAYRRT